VLRLRRHAARPRPFRRGTAVVHPRRCGRRRRRHRRRGTRQRVDL